MKLISFTRLYGWLLFIGGLFGFAASAALTIEKMLLLENPNYKLSCSFNEIFACGSIVTTEQASLFGFANSIIGVASFPVLVTVGVLILAGVSLPNFFRHGLLIGTTLAHIFVIWLVIQSLYVIGALCPWCMVVWTVTVPINIYSFAEGRSNLLARNFAALATFGWFAVAVTLITARFYI